MPPLCMACGSESVGLFTCGFPSKQAHVPGPSYCKRGHILFQSRHIGGPHKIRFVRKIHWPRQFGRAKTVSSRWPVYSSDMGIPPCWLLPVPRGSNFTFCTLGCNFTTPFSDGGPGEIGASPSSLCLLSGSFDESICLIHASPALREQRCRFQSCDSAFLTACIYAVGKTATLSQNTHRSKATKAIPQLFLRRPVTSA
ncbi:hypothetical protein BCR34DRAFT_277609 [Clohesyomyces aquaticus]|uniref:Uncharacterized protein n=1 Tax=Clohesyomyces aquaticus TaxID=1231657 RepID=A0A1Y1ZTA3_9PLEO|nr:hypothetical protein BCR34DRAFT_277609 [Clohesyomyces aquaticus]